MRQQDIITGIDLGSRTIRIAAAQIREPENEFQIIALAEERSLGIKKGVITNIEDTISSISSCLEKVERQIGQRIEHACVGVSGVQIISQESKGAVMVNRTDGEITEEDVERVLENARITAQPANYEIIHVLPRNYSVDNQVAVANPIGMTGRRLEVEAQVILGLSNQIKNLKKSFYRAGVEVDEPVFIALASAEAVLNKRQKELGVAVVNLGSATTSLAVYEDGDVLTAKTLPIGARHITNDLAIGLRVGLDLAEAIKVNYGTCLLNKVGKNEEINYKDLDERESGITSRKEVVKIIQARCEEIFKMVDNELFAIDRNGQLPAGVILTGAGAKLDGLAEIAKSIFKMPASIGKPQGFTSGFSKAYDESCSSVVGLALWGKRNYLITDRRGFSLSNLIRKIKSILKIWST